MSSPAEKTFFAQHLLMSDLITHEGLRSLEHALVHHTLPPLLDPLTLDSLPHAHGIAATELDVRLANAAIAARHINRWQAAQLLQGRTKFTLGHFQIIGALGSGGYGQVFLGRDTRSESSLVAVKVLPMARAKSAPTLVERFLHEIDSQRALSHPHIARFLDAGHDANVHYMVHEYVGGHNVRQWIKESGMLRYDYAATIVAAIAQALQALHNQGLIHRDVKPANILLTPGGIPKLIDMGLLTKSVATSTDSNSASAADDITSQEHSERIGLRGKVAGTVDYIAPDQVRHPNAPSAAWDIYALGCTLYHLLTGNVPFPDGTSHEKFHAHLHKTLVDPRVRCTVIPCDIASLTLEMLAKEPRNRTASCDEVAARLAVWATPIPPMPSQHELFITTTASTPPPILS